MRFLNPKSFMRSNVSHFLAVSTKLVSIFKLSGRLKALNFSYTIELKLSEQFKRDDNICPCVKILKSLCSLNFRHPSREACTSNFARARARVFSQPYIAAH